MLVALIGTPAGAQPQAATVSATVGSSPAGQPLPAGWLGVSLEYDALHVYTGSNPRAVNPLLVQLLRNLAPGQAPVIRVGGDSADFSWWPARGVVAPAGVRYALTQGWLRTTRTFASKLGARLIMGVNLAGGRRRLAAVEARALLAGIGRRFLESLEIGNEPDVYNVFPWYRDRQGRQFFARGPSYSLSDFLGQFTQWRAALPRMPIAGPALSQLAWLSALDQLFHRGLQLVTIHRYPLRAGVKDPSSAVYPSIPNLLSDRASGVLAQNVAPYVSVAHSHQSPFRVDELNSASHFGQRGVSNTFASALWVLDTLFNLASVGVDGVNIHSLPGAAYELFTFRRPGGQWRAFVHPEYYGLLMFKQAFPPGAVLLPVSVSPSGPLKVWAAHARDHHTRIVIINKDVSTTYQVQIQVAGAETAATLERLQAPSASATNDVTLGGQSFGDETTTGTFPGRRRTQPVIPILGTYTVTMPPASAALLTPYPASGGAPPR